MWLDLIVLAATLLAFQHFYGRSLAPAALAKKLGDRAARRCTVYRFVALAAMAVHLAWCWSLVVRSNPASWLLALPGNRGLWLALGAILAIPAGYFLLRGLWDAGRRNLVAGGTEQLFGGIYRELRHPQYLGFVLALWSLALLGDAPALIILGLCWLLLFLSLVPTEERDLEERLGETYRDYRKSTGRFITLTRAPQHTALTHCLNCGTELNGKYCHRCGQKGTELNKPITDIVGEYIRDEIRINARFTKTLAPLLFRPGFLTAEYVAGRRVRYLPPLRAYLYISIVTFFLLAMASQGLGPASGQQPAAGDPAGAASRDSLGKRTAGGDARPAQPDVDREDRDSLSMELLKAVGQDDSSSLPGAERIGSEALDTTAVAKGVQGTDTTGALSRFNRAVMQGWLKAQRQPGRMVESAVSIFTRIMFLLLPLFALLLKLLYLRHRRYYVQHLVFSLHFHAFTFLVISAVIALHLWAGPSVTTYSDALGFAVPFYLFLGMKRFYGQGPAKTMAKFLLLSFSYLLIFTVGVAAAIMLSLASL